MQRLVIFTGLIALLALFTSCEKNYDADESALYGVWVKGSGFGDTLWFTKKNDQYVMRKAESFNAGMPVYSEREYRFKNGRLSIKAFAPFSDDYYDIDSFTWTSVGTEFKVQGIQLFMFMSSTNIYFTYHKL